MLLTVCLVATNCSSLATYGCWVVVSTYTYNMLPFSQFCAAAKQYVFSFIRHCQLQQHNYSMIIYDNNSHWLLAYRSSTLHILIAGLIVLVCTYFSCTLVYNCYTNNLVLKTLSVTMPNHITMFSVHTHTHTHTHTQVLGC